MSGEGDLGEEEVVLPSQAGWVEARLLFQFRSSRGRRCVEYEKSGLSSVEVRAIWEMIVGIGHKRKTCKQPLYGRRGCEPWFALRRVFTRHCWRPNRPIRNIYVENCVQETKALEQAELFHP